MQKKIPLRKCLGCNESKPKNELIRIVRSPEGEIGLDFVGKKSGRGAYLCKNTACFLKLKKSRRADRSLDVEIPQEIYLRLEQELKDNEEQA